MPQQSVQRPPDGLSPPLSGTRMPGPQWHANARPVSMSEDRILRDRYLAGRRPQSAVGATGVSANPRAFVMAAAARASQRAPAQQPVQAQLPIQSAEQAMAHRRNRSLSAITPQSMPRPPQPPRQAQQGRPPPSQRSQAQLQARSPQSQQARSALPSQGRPLQPVRSQTVLSPSRPPRQQQLQQQPLPHPPPPQQARMLAPQVRRQHLPELKTDLPDLPDGSPSPATAAAFALHQRRSSTSSSAGPIRSREGSITGISGRRPSTVSSSSSGKTVIGITRSRSNTLTNTPSGSIARLAAGQAISKPSFDSTDPELAMMAARSESRQSANSPGSRSDGRQPGSGRQSRRSSVAEPDRGNHPQGIGVGPTGAVGAAGAAGAAGASHFGPGVGFVGPAPGSAAAANAASAPPTSAGANFSATDAVHVGVHPGAAVAAGAAARASATRSVEVAPREPPLSAKLRSNLAQALKLEARKREEEAEKEKAEASDNGDSDSDDYGPRDDLMMQRHNLLWRRATETADAAARSARRHQLMAAAASRPSLEPRYSSDSQSTTQSSNKTNALSAAVAARSRAQSAVAKIYMEASQLSDSGNRVTRRMKRYRPTAQWSAFPPHHGAPGPSGGLGAATLRRHPAAPQRSAAPEQDDDARSTTSSRSTPASFESAYSRMPAAPPMLPASHIPSPVQTQPQPHPQPQPPAQVPPLAEPPFGMTDPVKLEPKHKKHGFWKKLLGGSSSSSHTRSVPEQPPADPDAPRHPHLENIMEPAPLLMQTLRRNDSRRRFNQDKPWKHHRVEQAMTERERKRYEKLWAANRGTFLKYFVFFDPDGNPILPDDASSLAPLSSTGSSTAMLSPTSHVQSNGTMTPASSTSTPNAAGVAPTNPACTINGTTSGAMASPSASVTSVAPSHSSGNPYLHPSSAHTSATAMAVPRPPSFSNQSTHSVAPSVAPSVSQSVLSASPGSLGPPLVPTVSNTSLVSTTSSADALIASESDVHGYVVSRIWKRSCLPEDTLGRVWDLVDTNKDGTLDRSSFVVGMWLVDQCLYGRKLPNKVDDVVWQSVGQLHVKIRVGKPHHHRNIVQRAPHAAVHGGKHLVKATAKGAAKGGISVVRKAVGSNSSS